MASKESQKCCITGFFHEGSPKGEFKQVCGLETYVTGKNDSERFIVILTDIFGHKYNNVQLIADKIGDAGYQVFIPDILFGDAVVDTETTNLKEWLARHHTVKTVNLVRDFFRDLRGTYSPKFVGTIGYCFGAKYVVQQLHQESGQADVGAIAHPSFVSIEEMQAIGKPILISAAETDTIFSEELRHESEKILREKGATYQINLFSGVQHGFAVRGDTSDANVRYAMGRALLDQIYWFDHFSEKAGTTGK